MRRKPVDYIPTWLALTFGAAALAIALLTPACVLAADTKSDRERKARAALAISGSAPAPAVGAAPMPRVAAKLPYPDGHRKALVEELPLVVFVSCDMPKPVGAISARADAPFAGVESAGVVVGYPAGGRLVIDSTLTGADATPEKVQRAVDAAGKKLDGPPKQMPPAGKAAPAPLDWSIAAEFPTPAACVCGDSCECAKNGKKCPGQCPVQQVQCPGGQCPLARPAAPVAPAAPAAPCVLPGHVWAFVPGVGYTFITPADLAKLGGRTTRPTLSDPYPVSPCPGGNCPLKPARKVD